MRIATSLLVLTVLAVPAAQTAAATDFDGNPGTSPPEGSERVSNPPTETDGNTQIFTDQAAFLAAAGTLTTETCEDHLFSATCAGAGDSVFVLDGITATSSPAALKLLRDPCFGNHNTTPGGRRYLGADTESAQVSADVTLAFDQAVTRFGFYLVDLDTTSIGVTINGVEYVIPPNGDGGESYFGIITEIPFTTASFHVLAYSDSHYSFDDMAWGRQGFPVSAGSSLDSRTFGRVKTAYR